jgi:hypothetical protein
LIESFLDRPYAQAFQLPLRLAATLAERSITVIDHATEINLRNG